MEWDNLNDLDRSAEALQAEIKKAIAEAATRKANPSEFYHLLSRYPYLEIGNIDAGIPPVDVVPKLHTLNNGWVIHDYGYRLRCGKPALLSEKRWSTPIQGEADEDEEGGVGTVTMQFVEAAAAMVALAIKLGWEGLEIIMGFYPMRRAAWIAAVQHKFPVEGFQSTFEDRVLLDWVQKMKKDSLKKATPGTP
ncbi:MAG: hypothetical protein ACX932_01495 [Gammaproteobacteria bacterium]